MRLRRSPRLRPRSATGSDLPADEGPAQGRRHRSRVFGIADRPHYAEPRRACLNDLRRPRRVDPSDRVEGEAGILGGEADQLEADRGTALLGRRLPDRADADVVDPLGVGDLLLGVGREADDRVGAEDLAGLGDRDVVLADVDPVGVAGAGQAGIVVDDEQRAVGVAEAAKGLRRRSPGRGGSPPCRGAGRCRRRRSGPLAAAAPGPPLGAPPRRRNRGARCAGAHAAADRRHPGLARLIGAALGRDRARTDYRRPARNRAAAGRIFGDGSPPATG